MNRDAFRGQTFNSDFYSQFYNVIFRTADYQLDRK